MWVGRNIACVKPYAFKLGNLAWPDDSVLHVYAPIDLDLNPDLAVLISRCRDAVADDPITLVDDAALHITVDALTDPLGTALDNTARRELADTIGTTVADAPAYHGYVAGCLSTSSGAVLNVSPAQPLTDLHHLVRGAIHSLHGPQSTASTQTKAHISLGYCCHEVDSDLVQRHLRAVDPSHAALQIDELRLVEVRADPETGTLTWDTLDRFALRR